MKKQSIEWECDLLTVSIFKEVSKFRVSTTTFSDIEIGHASENPCSSGKADHHLATGQASPSSNAFQLVHHTAATGALAILQADDKQPTYPPSHLL